MSGHVLSNFVYPFYSSGQYLINADAQAVVTRGTDESVCQSRFIDISRGAPTTVRDRRRPDHRCYRTLLACQWWHQKGRSQRRHILRRPVPTRGITRGKIAFAVANMCNCPPDQCDSSTSRAGFSNTRRPVTAHRSVRRAASTTIRRILAEAQRVRRAPRHSVDGPANVRATLSDGSVVCVRPKTDPQIEL